MYGDEEYMDEEIIEALQENPFHHQEETIVEANSHDTQDNLQQTLLSPLVVDEIGQHIVGSHVLSPEFDEILQHPC